MKKSRIQGLPSHANESHHTLMWFILLHIVNTSKLTVQ